MKRIGGIWSSLTGGEKVVAGTACLAVLVTAALGAWALVKRPADVSNPDVRFEAERKQGKQRPANRPRDTRVDWPRYGYDRERTKFLNVQRVRPPFVRDWKYEQRQLIEFAPIVRGNRLFFIDNDGVFVALDARNGKAIWKRQYGSLNASSPHFEDGVLYAVNLSPPQALALRASDGKRIWSRSLPARSESSPMVVRNRVYFGTESGDFFGLNARNGKVVWQRKLAGAVKAAPAFSNGTLYVGDYAGRFYAIRATDGNIRWQGSGLGGGLTGSGRFYSTPAVAYGRVYVGNVDGRLYSFDQRSGELAWTQSAGNYIYSGVAAAQTRGTRPSVYFGSHDAKVYRLDARTGKVVWRESSRGQVSGPATVIGNIVYISTFSGNSTSGYDIRTGRRVFRFDDGEYGPAVSDGERLYLTGGSTIYALRPVRIRGNYRAKPGYRGVIPPPEWRRLQRGERRDAGGGNGGKKQGNRG